jgi:hypothetical protein
LDGDFQGMVDPGEVVKTTLKREFMEEAMNSLEASDTDRQAMEQKIDQFFSAHTLVGMNRLFTCWNILKHIKQILHAQYTAAYS